MVIYAPISLVGAAEISDANPSLLFEKMLDEKHLDAFIIDQGIERSDRVSTYLLLQAGEALKEGRGDEALKYGRMASKISPLSPTPHFFLAKIVWQENRFAILDAFSYFTEGVRLVFGDFLLVIPFLSPLFLLLILAVLLSFLVFVLYSLISFLPIWVHQITEASKGYLQLIPAALLFIVIWFTPLLLGMPILWFLLFSLALFWGFYSRIEKGVVFTFIFALGLTPWILPLTLTLFTANSSMMLNEMSRNYRADYLWTSPSLDVDQDSWEGLFILASYEAQHGHYEKATQLYQKALISYPNAPMILNNLGNLAYYQKNYNQAIAYYEQAIDVSPSLVSAYYNLSQSYREMLLFEKGEELFTKAKELSAKSTDIYAKKSARYPNYPVIEERFTKADLLKRFVSETRKVEVLSDRIWQGGMGQIPLQKAPGIAIIWVVLLMISGFLHRRLISANPCAFCKKAICRDCEKRLFSYQVCKQCDMRFGTVKRKSDFSLVEDAIKKISVRSYLMFLFPGGGHFAIRKTKMAFFLLSIFFLLLSYIFLGDFLVPPTEWYLHQSRSPLPIILIIFLYLSAFTDLAFKRSRGQWL